jgi:hypothetical protein
VSKQSSVTAFNDGAQAFRQSSRESARSSAQCGGEAMRHLCAASQEVN